MMTECPLCGEPLEEGMTVCPLCDAPLGPDTPPEEEFPPLAREEPPPEDPPAAEEDDLAFLEKLPVPAHAMKPQEKPKPAFFWWYIPILTGVFALGILVGVLAAAVATPASHSQAPRSVVVEGSPSSLPGTSSQAPAGSESPGAASQDYEVSAKHARLYEDGQGALVCDALAEITNTGDGDLYLREAAFGLTSPTGDELGACTGTIYSGPEIIKPGERGYFYCNSCAVEGDGLEAETRVALVPTVTVENAAHDIVRYDVSDMTIQNDDPFLPFSVTGRLENSTGADDTMVRLTCILYDKDKNALAAYGSFISELPAGKGEAFELPAYSLSGIAFEDISTFWVFVA